MKINLLFVGIVLLLASCDPVRGIEFMNKTDSIAEVIITLDTSSVYYQQEQFEMEMVNNDSIVITLEANETKRFYLGMGNWSKEELKLFGRSMKKLDIVTKENTTAYDSLESIYELLNNSETKGRVLIEIE